MITKYLATHDTDRQRLIRRIHEALHGHAVYLTPQTIELVLDLYDQRCTRAGVDRNDALSVDAHRA